MPSAPADLEAAEELVAERPGPKEILRRSFISGLAVLLPLVVTLFVISFVVGFLANTLDPLVAVLQETPYFGPGSDGIILALSIFSFVCIVVLIGIVAEFYRERKAQPPVRRVHGIDPGSRLGLHEFQPNE